GSVCILFWSQLWALRQIQQTHRADTPGKRTSLARTLGRPQFGVALCFESLNGGPASNPLMAWCVRNCVTLLRRCRAFGCSSAPRHPRHNPMSMTGPKQVPSTIVREDEGALVAAAKSGDLAAFEELVNRYERRIFRLTMNITQNREDAEDA